MKIYVGGVGKITYIKHMLKKGVGMCVPANQWRYPKRGIHWFLDNGAYSAFTQGAPFDSRKFLTSIEKIESCWRVPDFIVCPDIVAAGKKSLRFSLSWYDKIPAGCTVYIAVQDGVSPRDIIEHVLLFDGIFVGGTLKWKFATMKEWVEFAHSHDIPCHVGRIGGFRRLVQAREYKVDSVDSSTFVQKDSTGPFGQWGGFRRIEAYEKQTVLI
jgi:hypothetical protein